MSQFHPVLGCSNLGSMFQIRYIYGAISPGFILSKVSNVDPNSMLYCSHPLVLQVLSVTKNSSKIRHFFTISDFLLFIMNQFHGKYAYCNRIYIYMFFLSNLTTHLFYPQLTTTILRPLHRATITRMQSRSHM